MILGSEKVLFLEQVSEFLRRYKSVIEQPLNVMSTTQDQSAIVSVYPNGLLYNQFLKYDICSLKERIKAQQ